NWTAFDNFRLYRYYTYFTPSVTSLGYDNLYTSSSFLLTGGSGYLTSDITLTVPTGITLSGTNITGGSGTYTIALVNANTNNTITATWDGSTPVLQKNITISATNISGSISTSVRVNASSNTGCYTQAYTQGNMIANPTISAVDLTTGGFGGWGIKGIDNKNPYCGGGSAYITGANLGSIDRALTAANGNAFIPNTKYRLRAMINSKASAGKYFQFQVQQNGSTNQYYNLTNTSGWTQFDQTFTTPATVGEYGIYFNSFTASQPLIGDSCFIDNYEMYAVPKTYTSSSSLTFLTAAVTKKIAVRASNLTSDITITAPASFTVDKNSMLKTVSGSSSDSLAITFNGPNSASGYVYLTSGSVKDSIQVTGTVAPTLLTSVPYLSLDELNTGGTFTVSGGNLLTGITMSAPTGITLSPTSLLSSANNEPVTVTYDAAANSTGYITLTSGEATTRVRILARKNSESLTPLYSSTNLITDPYLNSLSTYGGWGTKTVVTDTTKVYGGSRCVLVGTGAARNSGSMDFNLTGKLVSNTIYRVKAMVQTVGAGLSMEISVGGAGIGGVSADKNTLVTTNGAWQPIDFNFTTGTLTATQGIYFNNSNAATALSGYIDNYELYAVPKTYTSSLALTYLSAGTKKVSVRAAGLTNDITITAPAGYSVSPSTMLATVTGATTDSVAITFNGGASANGFVYFTSGIARDSVQVTGIATPTLETSVPYLSLDELTNSGTFTVTGRNLLAGVTLTAPTGITLSSSSLLTNPTAETVTVTYDAAANSTGYITLTSGAVSTRVRIVTRKNTDTFTPLNSGTNIITDPTFNSLTSYSSSWGNPTYASITTDTTIVAYGSRCGMVTGTRGGSIAYPLTGKLTVNTLYRVKAKVNIVSGTFNLNVTGWSGVLAEIAHTIPTATGWQDIDFTFTTGATIGVSPLLYFNNFTANTAGVGYIDNLEMFSVPGINVSQTFIPLDETTNSTTFTATAVALSGEISISAPAGITVSPTTLAADASAATVTVTFDPIATATSGYVTLTSGSATRRIRVLATKNSATYTPLYSDITNIITDPYLNSLTAYSSSWGTGAITTDTTVVAYGSRCGMVTGIRAGSVTYPLSGKLAINTLYHVKAKVNIVSGTFNLNVVGWSGASTDFTNIIPNVVGWQIVDFTFTTGATLGGTPLLYFNNFTSNTAGVGYIDNLEMYAVPGINTSVTTLALENTVNGSFTVTGVSLADGITLDAPAGFTLSTTTLANNANAAEVTVNFTGNTVASGNITLTSGAITKTIAVTGTPTFAPTSATKYYLLQTVISSGKVVGAVSASQPSLENSENVNSQKFEFIATATPHVYYLKNNVNMYLNSVGATTDLAYESAVNSTNSEWAVVGTVGTSLKLKNVATGTYLTSAAVVAGTVLTASGSS
ncbi:MAG: hypothetical protein WCJ61_07550, partial [Paludibacter sp.]